MHYWTQFFQPVIGRLLELLTATIFDQTLSYRILKWLEYWLHASLTVNDYIPLSHAAELLLFIALKYAIISYT